MSDGIHDGNVTSPPLQRDDPRVEAEMLAVLKELIQTHNFSGPLNARIVLRDFAARERDRARREALEEAKSRISDFRINTWLSSMERSGLSEAIRTIDALISPQAGKADESGWIEWGGGECPVDPNQHVSVRFRRGHEDDGRTGILAGDWTWKHAPSEYDIVAYRIAQHVPIPAADPLDRAVTDWRAELAKLINGITSRKSGEIGDLRVSQIDMWRLADALERAEETT